jgi:hypothetical protein
MNAKVDSRNAIAGFFFLNIVSVVIRIGISLDSKSFNQICGSETLESRDFYYVPDPDPQFSYLLDWGERICCPKNNSINI